MTRDHTPCAGRVQKHRGPAAEWVQGEPWRLNEPQDVIASGRVTKKGECVIRRIPPGTYIVTASCNIGTADKAQMLISSTRATFKAGHETEIEMTLE